MSSERVTWDCQRLLAGDNRDDVCTNTTGRDDDWEKREVVVSVHCLLPVRMLPHNAQDFLCVPVLPSARHSTWKVQHALPGTWLPQSS